MSLLPRILKPVAPTGAATPAGNLDDTLIERFGESPQQLTPAGREAQASIEALAAQPARAVPAQPFAEAPPERRGFSIALTPAVRGLKINSAHPLESTVEEIGGTVTVSISW